MNAPLPTDHIWYVDPETDREVRAQVSQAMVEYSESNFNWLTDNLPGMKNLSGRERLRGYESTDEVYWTQLFQVYPRVAEAMLLDWAQLYRRYGEQP